MQICILFSMTFTIYKILLPLLLLKQQQGDTKEPSQLKDDLKSQSVSHNGTKAREQRCIFKWDFKSAWCAVANCATNEKSNCHVWVFSSESAKVSGLLTWVNEDIWVQQFTQIRDLKKINSVWFSSISNNIWVESRQQSSLWTNFLLKRKKRLAERGSGRGSHLSRPAGVWGERDGKKTGA